MKRKLRIFSNIAIICLSVCMFAFGVYAASTVSVTTSGTVTFSATGVYARVQRTVTGTAETVADFDQTIDSSSTSPVKVTELAENLTFANPNFPIIMTFTITNLAEDRNLDFTFTGFNNGVEEGLDGNVAAYFMSSTDKYSGEKYNIHPMTEGLNNVETITISFYVIDANKSASLEYDYALNLTNQDIVLKDNLPITVNDTSTTKNSTARVVKKVGNTVILGATLNSDSQFLDFEATGASTVKHYAPTLVDNEIQKPLLVVDANATGYVSRVENRNTSVYYYSENSIGHENEGPSSSNLIIPMAYNDNGSTYIIESIREYAFGENSNTISVTIPSSITTLGTQAFYGCSNLETIIEYGSIEVIEGYSQFENCNKNLYFTDETNNLSYVKSINNNYFIATCNGYLDGEVGIINENCCGINNAPFPGSSIKFMYIPGSVKCLAGYNYFSSTQVKSFIIPMGVKTIENDAAIIDSCELEVFSFTNSITKFSNNFFSSIASTLKTINFVGTQAEWNALNNIANAGIPSGVRINCLDGSFVIE